jgi:hypothetical protein
MPNRCYDTCPRINGITSMDNGDQSCYAAAGGITHRSVSVPLPLPDPVCGPITTSTGAIATIAAINAAGSAVSLGNWKVDPSNNQYVLSCDNLPGSVLKPASASIRVFRMGDFESEDFFAMLKLPTSGAGAYSRSTTVLPTPGIKVEQSHTSIGWNTSLTDHVTPYVCVKNSAVTCSSGFTYDENNMVCVQDTTTMVSIPVQVPEIQTVA